MYFINTQARSLKQTREQIHSPLLLSPCVFRDHSLLLGCRCYFCCFVLIQLVPEGSDGLWRPSGCTFYQLTLSICGTVLAFPVTSLLCDLDFAPPLICRASSGPSNYLTLQHCRSDCPCTRVEEENQLCKQLLLLQTCP